MNPWELFRGGWQTERQWDFLIALTPWILSPVSLTALVCKGPRCDKCVIALQGKGGQPSRGVWTEKPVNVRATSHAAGHPVALLWVIADKPSKAVALSQKQVKYAAITRTAAQHLTKGWEGKALYLAWNDSGSIALHSNGRLIDPSERLQEEGNCSLGQSHKQSH